MHIDYLADHPVVVAVLTDWILTEWFAPLGGSWDDAAELMAEYLQRDKIPLAFVALDGVHPVGMVSIVHDTAPDGRTWFACLTALYVQPSRRGRGIGTQLCRHALAKAQRLGFATVGLYTPDRETFYARLGWVKRGETIIDFGNRPGAVAFMERSVAEPYSQ